MEQGQAPKAAPPVDSVDALMQMLPDEPEDDLENAVVEGDDAEEPDQEPDPDPDKEKKPADDGLIPVTIKDEHGADVEKRVTQDELKAGFMMQADYQRKTAEVAREREQTHETIRKGIDEGRSMYTQNLQHLQQAFFNTVAPELQGINWNKLASEDPAEYVRMQARANQIQNVLQTLTAEQQRAQQEQEWERQQSQAKAIPEAIATLKRDIPNWSTELYQSVLKTGAENYGFAPEEVGNVVDPRMIKVLHDAHQYRQLKAGKALVASKVVTVPKVVKPGVAVTNQDAQRERIEKAETNMKRAGGTREASRAALMARFT